MKCLKQDPNLKLSVFERILILFMGFTDNIFFAGAIFGWPQLVYVLKVDGIFSNLCSSYVTTNSSSTMSSVDVQEGIVQDNTASGFDFKSVSTCLAEEGLPQSLSSEVDRVHCAAQDEHFALIYTLSVICYGIPGIIVGFLLHYVGLRITRILGGMMIALSFIFLALTTAESPNWLFPAIILLAIGGNQVRMSSMQFGDLFPKNRSTTITVLTGVYAASASLFVIFSIAMDYGITRQTVCYYIAGFIFTSTLLSFVLPVHHIPHEGDAEGPPTKQKVAITTVPLTESLRTLASNFHLYWFFILLFSINLYQQFYNVWITASTCTKEEVSLYSTYFSYSNIICVFGAPLGGVLTDYLTRRAKKNQKTELMFRVREIQANFIPLFVTTLFAITLHICLFFFNKTAIMISLMCLIIVRPCIVAISTAYLRIRFPADHFNRLIGIYCTVSSALMYFQYPVFQWSQNSYYMAQGVTTGMIVLSLVNPLYLLATSQLKKDVKKRDRLQINCEQNGLTKV